MDKKDAVRSLAWVFSIPGNPTRLSQCGYLMHFLVQRTQLKLKMRVMAEPIQQRGSAVKGRSRSFPCSFPSQLLSFPTLLHWFWVFSDSLLSVFCLLTWQGEGEGFLLWTVVSCHVSEFSVSIKCCIVQDPLNAIREDESMPRKYCCGMQFLCVYMWQKPSFEHG